jgi:hypothetical protein
MEQYNKGTAYLNKGNYEKAGIHLRKAIAEMPTAEAYLNLGTTYKALDRDSAAQSAFALALTTPAVTTQDVIAMANCNLGLMAYVYDNDSLAISYYDKAPQLADALWNKSTALLRQACSGAYEQFDLAWLLYEYRFLKTSPVTLRGTFGPLSQKRWEGQKNCRLLVLAEQGIGDNIMFSRFLPELRDTYSLDITLQSDIPYLWDKTVGTTFDNTAYDYILPIGSICRYVSTLEDTPYISRSGNALGGFNIGCVWAGSTTHSNNRHRSVSPQRFKRFSKYGTLWNLSLEETPKFMKPCNIKNWEETATWIASMDLIITVDTSVAHMAGAMGKPVWLIQPYKETDFRYGSGNTSSNIWYSSMKVYRNPQDWDFVFDTLEGDLV